MNHRSSICQKHSIILIILISLFNLPFIVFSQEAKEELSVKANAEVDKDSINIGDKIRYTITVTADKDIDIEFPQFGENLAGFAIRDFGSKEKGLWRKKTLIRWYLLDTYATGKYTIPDSSIKYKSKNAKEWNSIQTKEIHIEVKSILEKEANADDIRDIKSPVNFPVKLGPYIIIGIIVLLISAGVLVIFVLKKRKVSKERVYKIPAHEAAYKRLQELQNDNLPGQGKAKEYYIRLSDIVRHYLEDRFALKAPEMTTEEFLLMLKVSKTLSYEHKDLLQGFLSHCDMVKFAKYGPSGQEIDSSFESGKRLIDQTKLAEPLREL